MQTLEVMAPTLSDSCIAESLQPTNRVSTRGSSFLRRLLADRELHAVLSVWFLCILAVGYYIRVYGLALPMSDEWDQLIPLATGQESLTWKWLWRSAGEHRTPALRLVVYGIGRLANWDMRWLLYFNLACLAVGSLSLILAARAMRGHSTLSDAFLALIVLTPGQYESLLLSFSYTTTIGFLCIVISLAAVRWPQRSIWALFLYLLGVQVIVLTGGPSGLFWAMSLGSVVLLELFRPQSVRWKACAAIGFLGVTALCWIMYRAIPPSPDHHKAFLADSNSTILKAASQLWVFWAGKSIVVIQPWALGLLIVPAVVILVRGAINFRKQLTGSSESAKTLPHWVDLFLVLLGTLAVGLAIGYGRGRYPHLLSARYATLMLPVGIALYVLLVRMRTHPAIPSALTMVLAVSIGWSWWDALHYGRDRSLAPLQFQAALKGGDESLSVLAVLHCTDVSCSPPTTLLNYLLAMRQAGICVFKDKQPPTETVPAVWNHKWEAELGTLSGGAKVESVPGGAKVLEARTPGSVTYTVEVPTKGDYVLWCWAFIESPDPTVIVEIDGTPQVAAKLPPRGAYLPKVLAPRLHLTAGTHRVTLHLPASPSRIDSLVLMTRVE